MNLGLPVGGCDLGAAGGSAGDRVLSTLPAGLGDGELTGPTPSVCGDVVSPGPGMHSCFAHCEKSVFRVEVWKGLTLRPFQVVPTLGDRPQQCPPGLPGLWTLLPHPFLLLFFSSNSSEPGGRIYLPPTPLPLWQFSGELGHSLPGHP